MTIYALSSGPGISGVAIIRISGSKASEVIKSLTGKRIPKPRMATLRKINYINTSELIDEGIIIWFPGPESYTGEDMAEIHVHGGKAVVLALQEEIAKIKMQDLNANDLEAAVKIIAGSAESMGIEVIKK